MECERNGHFGHNWHGVAQKMVGTVCFFAIVMFIRDSAKMYQVISTHSAIIPMDHYYIALAAMNK